MIVIIYTYLQNPNWQVSYEEPMSWSWIPEEREGIPRKEWSESESEWVCELWLSLALAHWYFHFSQEKSATLPLSPTLFQGYVTSPVQTQLPLLLLPSNKLMAFPYFWERGAEAGEAHKLLLSTFSLFCSQLSLSSSGHHRIHQFKKLLTRGKSTFICIKNLFAMNGKQWLLFYVQCVCEEDTWNEWNRIMRSMKEMMKSHHDS